MTDTLVTEIKEVSGTAGKLSKENAGELSDAAAELCKKCVAQGEETVTNIGKARRALA